MPTSPSDMMSAVASSLGARTGRDLKEWVALVESSGIAPLNQRAVRRWLAAEHGVPQNSQWAIADAAARAAGWRPTTIEEHIDQQYSGARAALRPIFETVRDLILACGPDVTMEGRSSYIPFIRRRQFAAIAASTKTRLDLGVRFRTAPDSNLLLKTSPPGQSTHRIPISNRGEVTDEVRRLITLAYEQNG